MTRTEPRVFISYQRADEAFARRVREHLAAHGVRTWMDQYDIPVGAYWPDEIDRGLASSDIIVGVLSPDAVESRNVKNEWDWALANDRRLVMLQVQPCIIPHRYISINFIDATADTGTALTALLGTLGVAGNEATPASAERTARHRDRDVSRRVNALARVKPMIVGREREQTALRSQLDAARNGTGGLVLIGGEAGIGKTTLTRWLLAEAEEYGAVILAGGCYDLTTTPPYGPWLEVFRSWSSDPHLPELADALHPSGSLSGIGSQNALFDLAADSIAAASVKHPLLVLLEDLHWTDQASLDLLRHIARLVANWSVLLVATYRDDELTRHNPLFQTLPVLIREADATWLRLVRLDQEVIRALIATRYPLADVDRDRLTAHVASSSGGNPFFAEEVLRTLEDTGALQQNDEGWHLAGIDRIEVPALVRQVIEGRLERLSVETRRMLEVAAVIGHEVDLDVWAAVSGADENTLIEVLEQALEAHLVDELPGGSRLRFTHALVRETLYEGSISLRRRSWHRQVGDFLAGMSGSDPDTVAHHYLQAGDPRAFDWLIRAGDRAQRAYAFEAAIAKLDIAQRLAEHDPARITARVAAVSHWQAPSGHGPYDGDRLFRASQYAGSAGG